MAEAATLFIFLIIWLLLSAAFGWMADELGHNPIVWGILFFVIGLWAVLLLLIWHLICLNDNGSAPPGQSP